MSKFVIIPVATGVKFELLAGNGESVAVSEVYSSRGACLRGIESVRKCAAAEKIADLTENTNASNPKFELYRDRRGAFRFRLRARNGQIVAHSEAYSTKNGCLAGIASVIQNAPEAQISETEP